MFCVVDILDGGVHRVGENDRVILRNQSREDKKYQVKVSI